MALHDCTSCQYHANSKFTVAHHAYGVRARMMSGVKFGYHHRRGGLNYTGLHVLNGSASELHTVKHDPLEFVLPRQRTRRKEAQTRKAESRQ